MAFSDHMILGGSSAYSTAKYQGDILRARRNGRHSTDDIFKFIFMNRICRILIQILLKCVPKFPINDKPTVVHIMALHRTGDNHYLSQWWPIVMIPICVTRTQWVNTLAPVRRGCTCNIMCGIFKHDYHLEHFLKNAFGYKSLLLEWSNIPFEAIFHMIPYGNTRGERVHILLIFPSITVC